MSCGTLRGGWGMFLGYPCEFQTPLRSTLVSLFEKKSAEFGQSGGAEELGSLV